MTPGRAAAALADLAISETLAVALAAQSASLAEQVRASLSNSPGGPHERPWLHTGALQASVANSSDGLFARVGSNDPAAAAQEMGTATILPRPFLAPAAATLAEPIAREIGQLLADLLARRLK